MCCGLRSSPSPPQTPPQKLGKLLLHFALYLLHKLFCTSKASVCEKISLQCDSNNALFWSTVKLNAVLSWCGHDYHMPHKMLCRVLHNALQVTPTCLLSASQTGHQLRMRSGKAEKPAKVALQKICIAPQEAQSWNSLPLACSAVRERWRKCHRE